MAELRQADEPVDRALLASLWHDPRQLDRAIAALIEDGLAEQDEANRLHLPK
jgi:A/G-specific adenine glycosylase